jgi:hypothetical protein
MGLACLTAFWLLGRRSAELAFFPDFGLAGATLRSRDGVTWARLVAFGGCTVAAAGGLACCSTFDVIVYLLVRQMPDSGHPSLRCSCKASDTVPQNPQNLVDFLWIIP